MDGALILDKPEGMTSHDVVDRVRRVVGTRRVGHAGTLDPFATGVLVICVERATRLVQFLVHLDKEYDATIRLGFATDTQDLTGEQIAPLVSSNAVNVDDVTRTLSEFKGSQLQLPPMFSAKRVAGERLYRAARSGREVEREPAPITVHSIELTEALREGPGGTREFGVRVSCSSGTYVRTLAHDIGQRLGVGAHLAALRRTSVGEFKIAGAATLEDLESGRAEMVTPAAMLGHLPEVRVGQEVAGMVAHGQAIRIRVDDGAQPVRICDDRGHLIAVGDYDALGQVLKPRVVLVA